MDLTVVTADHKITEVLNVVVLPCLKSLECKNLLSLIVSFGSMCIK